MVCVPLGASGGLEGRGPHLCSQQVHCGSDIVPETERERENKHWSGLKELSLAVRSSAPGYHAQDDKPVCVWCVCVCVCVCVCGEGDSPHRHRE